LQERAVVAQVPQLLEVDLLDAGVGGGARDAPGDVDHGILRVREALSEEHGEGFDSYDEIEPLWNPVLTKKKGPKDGGGEEGPEESTWSA
jgi:hypothetical protein